uniref:Cytochrome P450 n=1 Tax=Timema douglasi TaxID=61478 RepID=A0A7R8VMV1_TIMDO|nr:unnamed protein product [Timema douglasi]
MNVLMSSSNWLFLAALIICALYILGTWNYDYYSKQNIPYVKPLPFFGNMAPIIFRKIAAADQNLRLYRAHKGHRLSGIFQFTRPRTIIRDIELLKIIAIKDFDHFMNHFSVVDPEVDQLFGGNLFLLKGQRWRDMRATLSPSFTSSKMKNMFILVLQCGSQMAAFLEEIVRKSEKKVYALEMKDLSTRYTNDVIATTAFGVSVDSFRNPSNEFYLVGKGLTSFAGWRGLIAFGYVASSSLMKFLRIPFSLPWVSKFIYSLIEDTIRTREREGIVRQDMIHLLMQARKEELPVDQSVDGNISDTRRKIELSDKDIAAQAAVFFLAGFDTSSTLISFASYFLTIYENVQQRLQTEIDNMLENTGGKLIYEEIIALKYLDMVISETLRMYPPAPAMDRVCVKPYSIPPSGDQPGMTFNEGDLLEIPIFGIHRDEAHFPDPDKFDPERFSDENKHKIKAFTFIPFGLGPRSCIGNRFALMETKVALVYLLSRFNFKVVDKTPIPIRLSVKDPVPKPEGGFWLGLELRDKNSSVRRLFSQNIDLEHYWKEYQMAGDLWVDQKPDELRKYKGYGVEENTWKELAQDKIGWRQLVYDLKGP